MGFSTREWETIMIKLTYAQISAIHSKMHNINPGKGNVKIYMAYGKYTHLYVTIDSIEYHVAKNGNMKEIEVM